jgi:hypothetical protein
MLIEENAVFAVYDLADELTARGQPPHRQALGVALRRMAKAVEIIRKANVDFDSLDERALNNERAAIAEIVNPADYLTAATDAAKTALVELRAALMDVAP